MIRFPASLFSATVVTPVPADHNLFSVILGLVGSILVVLTAPLLRRYWRNRDRRATQTSEVTIAQIESKGRFEDRLLARITELETRITALETDREHKTIENERLKAEVHNISAKTKDLLAEVEDLRDENRKLREVVVRLTLENHDCVTR